MTCLAGFECPQCGETMAARFRATHILICRWVALRYSTADDVEKWLHQ